MLFGCNNKKQQVTGNNKSDMQMPARSAGGDTTAGHDGMNMPGMDSVYYTCSMHPQVMEPRPGKCPICGMGLIAVQKSHTPDTDELKLTDQQIQLGNIKTELS